MAGPTSSSRGAPGPEAYDQAYYDTRCGDRPYRRGEPHWEDFFGGIATEIVRSLRPRTVFDAGCGLGLLVEALWDRGVEADGRDVSPYAISQVRPDLRDRCVLGSLTDPVDGRYDLAVCIELVEHLAPADAAAALEHLTKASDRILFSSTPSDFDEPTHVNVRPPVHWVRAFAELGFAPALGYDATFVAPHALLFERAEGPVPDEVVTAAAALVASRLALGETRAALAEAEAERARLADLVVADADHAFDVEHRFMRMVEELDAARAGAEAAAKLVEAYEATRVMRYTRRLRTVYGLLRRAARATARAARPAPAAGGGATRYDLWVREFDVVTDERRARVAERLGRLERRPLVSILVPVFDPPEAYLRAALDSVLAQTYPEWELCAVDDRSTAAWVPKVLEEYAARDPRVRTVRRAENGHISAASNTALEMARGEWVALLDHDDVLTEHALALAVLALAERPDAALLYSDEDKIDDTGRRFDPYFKPDFDPLLLTAQNYMCHMTVLRRELAQEVGGFRLGLEGSQDWDLVLRASERVRRDQVVHVPHVLYHWRVHPGSTAQSLTEKPYWVDASTRAVREHLERRGTPGKISVNAADGLLRVRWPLPADPPRVSIIVPTRDGQYLDRCLDSIFSATGYPDFEVVVVDNGSEQPETAAVLARHARWIKVVRDDRPFNFSALNNAAARICTGGVLCLLNDDCEVLDYGWLEEMVSQLLQDGVGAVGAKLLYPDGRVQHAGVLLGVGGVAGHAHRFSERVSVGYWGWLFTARTLSAVTGACLAVRREAFEALGGLDEDHLGISYNDIDFCLRLGEAGWRVVWTPFASLVHHESVSRGLDSVVRPDAHFRERSYMRERWGERMRRDPAYNPNLTLDATGEQFGLAFPPRTPWWAKAR